MLVSFSIFSCSDCQSSQETSMSPTCCVYCFSKALHLFAHMWIIANNNVVPAQKRSNYIFNEKVVKISVHWSV